MIYSTRYMLSIEMHTYGFDRLVKCGMQLVYYTTEKKHKYYNSTSVNKKKVNIAYILY